MLHCVVDNVTKKKMNHAICNHCFFTKVIYFISCMEKKRTHFYIYGKCNKKEQNNITASRESTHVHTHSQKQPDTIINKQWAGNQNKDLFSIIVLLIQKTKRKKNDSKIQCDNDDGDGGNSMFVVLKMWTTKVTINYRNVKCACICEWIASARHSRINFNTQSSTSFPFNKLYFFCMMIFVCTLKICDLFFIVALVAFIYTNTYKYSSKSFDVIVFDSMCMWNTWCTHR